MKYSLFYLYCIIACLLCSACGDESEIEDNMAGESTDATAGVMAGTQAGVTAGTQAGTMTAGTQAGVVTAGTQAGTMAGTQAGTMAGTQAGTMAGTQAGTQAGTMAGTQAGTMAGTQAGTMAGMEIVDCSMHSLEMPCEVSIQAARQVSVVADLTHIRISGVITAVRVNADNNPSHLVIQDPRGGEYSGIWIYLNDAEVDPLPDFIVGSQVTIAAITEDYFGQRQLNTVFDVQVAGGNTPVNPVVLAPQDIATNGALASMYEGVLVRVDNVNVTELDPPAGPGDMDPTGEFVVNDVLRIDDFLSPLPMVNVGDTITAITGVLRLGNGDYKIVPRTSNEVMF